MKSAKKLVSILILIMIAVSLVSCSKDETEGKMDGWWRTANGSIEFTIKNGKVKGNNGKTGTISLSDVEGHKYVIEFVDTKDGYSKTYKFYIDRDKKDYDKYIFWLNDSLSVELIKIND